MADRAEMLSKRERRRAKRIAKRLGVTLGRGLSVNDQERVPYFIPPDDYRSISHDGCAKCGQIIGYFPVVGGHKWQHITRSDHEVVIPRPWWDVGTGRYREEVFVRTGE